MLTGINHNTTPETTLHCWPSLSDIVSQLQEREVAAGIVPEAGLDAFMKGMAVDGAHTNLVTEYVLKVRTAAHTIHTAQRLPVDDAWTDACSAVLTH